MWTEGTIQVGTSTFHYWVKHYEEPSIYGYEEGRASKITLRRNAETVFNFDRGLDVPPTDAETETALAVNTKSIARTAVKACLNCIISLYPSIYF